MRTYSSKYFHPRLGDSSQELSWLSTLSTLRGLVGNLEGKCLFRLHVQYAYYNRKKFVFYDNDGNLVCNPLMYMMALASADNAFVNDFTCAEQIMS